MATSRTGIPPEILQQIRDAVDILNVVSRYVTLSKAGHNHRGLCPFHDENTPSFTVTPSRQMFYCFGCGVGGDVFTFLMRKEGLGFLEAVDDLAEQAGITLPRKTFGDGAPAPAGQRKRLEALHAQAAAWFQRNLHDPEKGRSALEYLANRGLAPDTVQAFGLGYAPSSWDGLTRYLTGQGASAADLEASGLVVSKGAAGASNVGGATNAGRSYDRFRGRVMVPIHDLRGNVMAFGGRVFETDDPAKYLNSPETPLFQKGRSLYGLHEARTANHAMESLLLVEGYFDVLALWQADIRHVVAPMGTALTTGHAALLRRFVKTVTLNFDGDAAGTGAALRALDVFRESGVAVKVVVLPRGQDPDSYVRAHGAEAFLALQDRAVTLLEFAVAQCLEGATRATIEERTRRVDAVLDIVAKGSNPVEKSEQIQRVAERLGVRPQLLLDRYPALAERRRVAASQRRSGAPLPARPGQVDRKVFREERAIVALMVQGRLRAEHLAALRPEDFQSPPYRRLVEMGVHCLDAAGCLDAAALFAAIDEDDRCRESVAELAASDAYFDNQDEYIHGCLRALNHRNLRVRLDELIAQLRIAEREQRTEDVGRLNAEIEVLRGKKAALAASAVAASTDAASAVAAR